MNGKSPWRCVSCGNIVLTVAVVAILITAPFGALCIDIAYKKLLSKNDETSITHTI